MHVGQLYQCSLARTTQFALCSKPSAPQHALSKSAIDREAVLTSSHVLKRPRTIGALGGRAGGAIVILISAEMLAATATVKTGVIASSYLLGFPLLVITTVPVMSTPIFTSTSMLVAFLILVQRAFTSGHCEYCELQLTLEEYADM